MDDIQESSFNFSLTALSNSGLYIAKTGYAIPINAIKGPHSKEIDYEAVEREMQIVDNQITMLLRVLINEGEQDFKKNLFTETLNGEETWTLSRLKDVIAQLEKGRSVRCDMSKIPASMGEWGMLKTSAVSTGIFLHMQNKRCINGKLPSERHARYEIKSGDFLINRANSRKFVGTSVIVKNWQPQLIVSDKLWRVILPTSTDNNTTFLYMLLNTPTLREQLRRLAWGSFPSMLHLREDDFLNLAVPLVSKDIQNVLKEKFDLLWDILNRYPISTSRERDFLWQLFSRIFSGTLTLEWWEEYKPR